MDQVTNIEQEEQNLPEEYEEYDFLDLDRGFKTLQEDLTDFFNSYS